MAEDIRARIIRDLATINAAEFENYFEDQLKAFPYLKEDTEFLRYIRENKHMLLKGYDMDKDVKEWKLSQKKDNSEVLQARIAAMQLADKEKTENQGAASHARSEAMKLADKTQTTKSERSADSLARAMARRLAREAEVIMAKQEADRAKQEADRAKQEADRAEQAADRAGQAKVKSSGGKKSKKRKSKKYRKKSRKSHKKRFPHKKSRNKRR